MGRCHTGITRYIRGHRPDPPPPERLCFNYYEPLLLLRKKKPIKKFLHKYVPQSMFDILYCTDKTEPSMSIDTGPKKPPSLFWRFINLVSVFVFAIICPLPVTFLLRFIFGQPKINDIDAASNDSPGNGVKSSVNGTGEECIDVNFEKENIIQTSYWPKLEKSSELDDVSPMPKKKCRRQHEGQAKKSKGRRHMLFAMRRHSRSYRHHSV